MLHKRDQEFDHPLTYFYKTDLGLCLNLPEVERITVELCNVVAELCHKVSFQLVLQIQNN